jgi:cell division transport system permease protein
MSLSTSTKRIVRYGLVGFFRNGFISLAAILIMTITLFVIGALMTFGSALTETLSQLTQKVDVNVYFVVEAPESDILNLKTSLERLPEVAEVTYVSRDEALARFKERHKNDQLTLQALEELGQNPLGASLAVRAKDTTRYESIAKFLENSPAATAAGEDRIIEKVNFSQNKGAIDRLSDIINTSRKLAFAAALFLALSSVLIAFNTIRLAIYTAKDEIAVMKLVGASPWYVRGPFIVSGVLYGLASALVVLVAMYPIALWLEEPSRAFFGVFDTFTYFTTNFWSLAVVVLGTGILLGALSSYLAVRRYLNN